MLDQGFVSVIDRVSDLRSSFGKEPYMRLLTLFAEFSVLARSIAQIAAIALCLSGCSTLGGASGVSSPSQFRDIGLTYRPNGPVYADPSKIYLRGALPMQVQTEYLDYYACATGGPVMCECFGRVTSTCDCHC
jgi:hypothetical protein